MDPPRRPMRNSSSSDACAEIRKRSDGAAAGPCDALRYLRDRIGPVGRLLRPRLGPKERALQTPVAFDPSVVEPPDVAHPIAVQLGIEPRCRADQLRSLRPFGLGAKPRRRIATLLAQRADRVDRVGVVPWPRLEPVVLGRDRADRADVHQIARQERMDSFLLEGRDLAAVTAIRDADLRVGVDFFHEPDAARAQDAPVAVQHQRRAKVHVSSNPLAVEDTAGELHPALVRAETVGEILQRAFPSLVAHRAIQWVIDQEELEHARTRFDHIRRLGMHDHAFGHSRRAGSLQLRHLLDLHDADTARPVDADPGVVAVVGNLYSAVDGRLQNRSSLFGGDLAPIYRQRDRFHS